ncbi:MAG: flagellar type III secretion system pore protein FliP [Tepidisphaeraceae bacterium]
MRHAHRTLLAALVVLLVPFLAHAQESPGDVPDTGMLNSVLSSRSPVSPSSSSALPDNLLQIPDLKNRETFSAALQILILLTVLSLAPAILIMMTSFTRIIIVLSLLRQALGTQQLPPNQVLIGLSLFMTFLVMGPTWQRINREALTPYMDRKIDQPAALARAQAPLHDFMKRQVVSAGNEEDVYMFCRVAGKPEPKNWGDVDTLTLVPAFMLSELKTAFLMGFKIYLPFLAVDIVVSTILISMGMMMLPPVLISLPFKLLLFVLADGWRLITYSLMGSFGASG